MLAWGLLLLGAAYLVWCVAAVVEASRKLGDLLDEGEDQ